WEQDETIGWVYQYFTPKEMREKARSESRSPRNSNELAFRNQFFTPRYVVEFLTDNTLGRIWYEMRKGATKLKDQCRYMIRRPTEIFLNEGHEPPETPEEQDELSQEELLKQPVHIPNRPKTDPRILKILDPACGSGHFLLHCFDLLLTIYEEAYTDPDLGPALQHDYPTLDDLRRDAPRLILAHNLHGIDIDYRATQIASLALWLRCQRAYQDMGLKKGRPSITRSHFVCAEPMPGESQMLKEFVNQLEPRLLGQLLEVIFDKMKLAGEAGSLLKIEEEIKTAITEAKRQYDIGGIPVQQTLFDKPLKAGEKRYSVQELPNDQFFERAETKVVQALKQYAEKASNIDSHQRHLFAEDAVQGFSFIELCHRRFDVVLMNPPFGMPAKNAKTYIETAFPNSKGDILAHFVERALHLAKETGFVAAISSRTCFYLTRLARFREQVLQGKTHLTCMADFGDGVLDATVETAAYVLSRKIQPSGYSLFFRKLLSDNKDRDLLESIESVNSQSGDDTRFFAKTTVFGKLPNSPYTYWVSPHTIRHLTDLPRLEPNTAMVRVGMQTGEDARFLRLIWEVPPTSIGSIRKHCDAKVPSYVRELRSTFRQGKRWAFYSKTDYASPWVSPLILVVDWKDDGDMLKDHIRSRGYSPSKWVQSEDKYFAPGFSYMLRSTRLVPYVVPPGVIPTAGRSQVYAEHGLEMQALGICASRIGSAIARFSGEMFARPKFQASMVQNIPALPLSEQTQAELKTIVESAIQKTRTMLSKFEPWQEFMLPAFLTQDGLEEATWQLETLVGNSVEESIACDAGLSVAETGELCRDLDEAIQIRTQNSDASVNDDDDDDEDTSQSIIDFSARSIADGFMSYLIGVVFGRWDVRFAMDRSLLPSPQQVLDPIPVCPPGSLVGTDGLPATQNCIVSEEWLKRRRIAGEICDLSTIGAATIPNDAYPIRVDWDGILVDDEGHQDDVLGRIRQVIELVSANSDVDIDEGQLCRTLDAKSLRDYFVKSGKGGFWGDHVNRYKAKRGRKAPIYWLLQSSKRNYGLWFYYHRLDKDMLFKALDTNRYVDLKLQSEENRLDEFRSKRASTGETGKEAKKLDREIEKQEDLLTELLDFEEKLRKVADLRLVPDLNDGVVLNIAPLHELVPWKEAKKYWIQLLEGKYEWSSIGKQLREKGLVK
ncbi:BREX-1 system adenine-specific DNA-methyltransferase PglX, partial [bacterium]|nr:BREX-1 system adenine-specific DNA-methyltransferase PglX [bacterium]